MNDNGGGDGDIDNTATSTTTGYLFPRHLSAEVPILESARMPDIDVEKLIWDGDSFEDADDPTGPYLNSGTNPVFKFVVTNIGEVTLDTITLSDNPVISPFYGDYTGGVLSGTCGITPASMAPDATFTCYGTLPWAAGQNEDTATATGGVRYRN